MKEEEKKAAKKKKGGGSGWQEMKGEEIDLSQRRKERKKREL